MRSYKNLIAVFSSIFIASTIFAASFSFEPKFREVFTAREVAIGENYISDTSSCFSFVQNPASAGFLEDRKIFPFFSADFGGDLASVSRLAKTMQNSSSEELDSYLANMDNIKANATSSGPICFGGVTNHFAWGIFNSTYADLDLNGTKDSSLLSGEQLQAVLCFGYPVMIGKSTLSLGLSVKGIADMQGNYSGKLSPAINSFLNHDMNFFPVYTTAAFGLDAGITFSIRDIGIISVAWNNFFAASVTQKFNSSEKLKKFSFEYDAYSKMPLDSNLKTAFAVKLPFAELTKGVLSKTNIFFQYGDLINVVKSARDGKEYNYVDPLALGFEIEFIKTVVLRYGCNNSYMSGGLGFNIDRFHIDLALHTSKACFTPNPNGDIGATISFGVYN